MISVVMTTYNGGKYLAEQLLSIMRQTMLPDELIISDDGSQDDTIVIIEKLIKQYAIEYPSVKIIFHQNKHNQGYINNFLNSIMVSKGDVVFLADQDDIWKKNKIKDMCECMKKYNALVIHSDIDIINEKRELIQHKWEKYNFQYKKNKKNQFLKKLNYCGMSMCFDGKFIRNCIPKIRNISIPTHDWTICACADIAHSFVQIGGVYTLRRYHEENVALKMDNLYKGDANERVILLQKYLNYYKVYWELLKKLKPNDYVHSQQVKKVINLTKRRIDCVINRKLINALLNIFYIKSYPTFFSYVGDVVYILNLKNLIQHIKNND